MAIRNITESQKGRKLICPHCGGDRLHKDGFAYMKEGRVQQFQCYKCRRRTIKPIVQAKQKGVA